MSSTKRDSFEIAKQSKDASRLSKPKRGAHETKLFGYTIQERLKEMREILKIKDARLKRLQTVSKQQFDLQEKVISLMKKEIQLKAKIINQAGGLEQRIVSDVLKDEMRTRLALRNSDIKGAMYALDEWFAFYKNVLNLTRYVRRQREKYFDDTKREMEYLDFISVSPGEGDMKKVARRYENNIAHLKARLETAQYLNVSYNKILDKYREESLTLSKTLEAMESAVRMHWTEMKDLMEMRHEIEVTLKSTQRHLARTEKSVQKSSDERRTMEAATRKKERDQRVEKFLSRLKKGPVVERVPCSAEGVAALGDVDAEERERETRELLGYIADFEAMKTQMIANDILEVLEALLKQFTIGEHLSELTHQREDHRHKLNSELENLQKIRQGLTEDEHGTLYRGKKKEEEMKQRMREGFKAQERMDARLASAADVLFQVTRGVMSIYDKLIKMDDIKLISIPRETLEAAKETPLDLMTSCMEIVRGIVQQVGSTSDLHGIEHMTKCSLFSEMVDDHIEVLMPTSSKPKWKQGSGILKDIDDIGIDIVGGILTREEMKKQHKKFYEQRKRSSVITKRPAIV